MYELNELQLQWCKLRFTSGILSCDYMLYTDWWLAE